MVAAPGQIPGAGAESCLAAGALADGSRLMAGAGAPGGTWIQAGVVHAAL